MLLFKRWFVENQVLKRLILMVGLPGSGKSSLAKQLGQGGVVFSTDDFFETPEGEYKFVGSMLHRYHQLNVDRTKEAMQKGISPIVIDNTNTDARSKKPYDLLAQEFGYTIEFREPETPWKYDAEELAKRNTHGVPKASIERMLRRWQPNIR